jgi:hypothetical protein
MLSYSVNTTFRADELFWSLDYESSNTWNTGRGGPGGLDNDGGGSNGNGNDRSSQQQRRPGSQSSSYAEYNNWSEHPPYGSHSSTYRKPYANKIDCDDTIPDSKAPWEIGVVWSPAGPVAAGAMLSGLAAGLEPQVVNWPNGQVDNGWAASLAGNIAQTALLKRKDEPYVGPDGYFNSTLCPSEFYLRMAGKTSYSHLTVSEINGGLDGLLLAEFSHEWQRKTELTLSHIVDMYYNPQWGIKVAGNGPNLAACERYSNYASYVDAGKLRQESFVFGSELRSILVLPVGDEALIAAILNSMEKLNSEIRLLDSSLDNFGPCSEERRRVKNSPESSKSDGGEYEGKPIDAYFPSSGIADVGIILDTSIFLWEDTYYLKQVTAALVNELDLWQTSYRENGENEDRYVAGGSVADVSDGRYGREIVKSADYGFNKAQMSCGILTEFIPMTGDLDPSTTLEVVGSRIAERQYKEGRRATLAHLSAHKNVLPYFSC